MVYLLKRVIFHCYVSSPEGKSSMNVDNLMIYLMHGDLDWVFTSKNGENMEKSVDLDCFFFHQQSTLDTAISNALLSGNE